MRIFRRKAKSESKEKTSRPAVMARGFAAAEIDRLLAGWKYDGGYTPSEIISYLEPVRAHSREMAKNNPHMKKFLSLVAINVVGERFSFKSTPHDIIKNEPVMDTVAAKFIEYHWWRFCNHRDPLTTSTWFDVTGLKTESEMDRLNAKTWARDGEYFIHIIRGSANPYGIAFRVLRPDWCDHKYNMSDTGRGTLIHAGVERDLQTRRPVAYWFHTTPTNAYAYNGRGQPLISIPARDIIHGFTQEDEDQPRGIPWTHAGLRKLKMLELYDEAEITAARDEACSTRSYQAQDGADMDAIIDLTDPDNAEVANVLTMEKQPGQAEIVPRGYKMEIHTPQHPNRELTAFKNSMLRDIATGFGVEYANFANDWAGVNFSSVRAGTISERDGWKILQNDMISQCKQVQFLVWLESFLTYSISGQLPMAKIEKFSEHEFRGRRWMWVDPVKDMNAAKMARDNLWKTDTDIAADLGYDYDDNLETMKREAESREKAGFAKDLTGDFMPVPKTEDDKDEE
jgi:lambda family phage portal protein